MANTNDENEAQSRDSLDRLVRRIPSEWLQPVRNFQRKSGEKYRLS